MDEEKEKGKEGLCCSWSGSPVADRQTRVGALPRSPADCTSSYACAYGKSLFGPLSWCASAPLVWILGVCVQSVPLEIWKFI